MTVIIWQGGLWEEDISKIIKEGESKGYEVVYSLEEDNYHWWVEWRIFL
ncbi:MAG: hypothetical protein ACFFD2_00475 [Promethearchaeota archaeon]